MIQGTRIRQVREQRALSQDSLGKLVAKDAHYISKVERGVLVSMTTTTLERLVHALHVSSDYLLGLSDQAAPAAGAAIGAASQPQTQAKQRQKAHGKTAPGRKKNTSETFTEVLAEAPPARDVAAAVVTPAASPAPARSPAMCPHCYTPMVPLGDGQGLVCPGCRYKHTGET